MDTTSEFYRLWSALQFVVCVPPTSENDMSCHELFGDGLMWAGCTIIHFLQQQKRFETFDFSYHILNVEDAGMCFIFIYFFSLHLCIDLYIY